MIEKHDVNYIEHIEKYLKKPLRSIGLNDKTSKVEEKSMLCRIFKHSLMKLNDFENK